MDGWRMPHSPRPDNPTGNDGYHKPRRKKVPYRVSGSKIQGSENRNRPRKITLNNTVLEELSKYKYLGNIYNTIYNRLIAVDGRRMPNRMPNPPQPTRTPTYTQYNEPRGQQIPYPICSSQMLPYSWNRKEGERCYRQYNCRNRKQRVQRNQNASDMADGRCHHHTHNDICMWRVDNQQGRKQKTTMHIQRNTKIPTQGNPHNDPPERNRQHTNRIHHQDKENPTSQAHRLNERRIPNKGRHARQNKHMEKTCNRPR